MADNERNSHLPQPVRDIINSVFPMPPAAPEPKHTEVEFMGKVETFPNDDDMFEEEERLAPFWTVAVYLVDKAYGGPEEGGWWYDCGERVDHALEGVPSNFILMVFQTAEAANEAATVLQGILDSTVNVGRRDISSVLSTGRYHAEVYNGHPPHHYPERTPHYE